MKTIEEKAIDYANENTGLGLSKEMAIRAYLAGATEALAGQWRKEDDTAGLQDGEKVIVAVQRVDNSIKYCFPAYFQNGCFWYEYDDTKIHLFNLWMRLPEPPKDESV